MSRSLCLQIRSMVSYNKTNSCNQKSQQLGLLRLLPAILWKLWAAKQFAHGWQPELLRLLPAMRTEAVGVRGDTHSGTHTSSR